MKKFTGYLTIFTLIGLAVVLAGCGKETTVTSNTASPNANVSADTGEAPYTVSSGTKQFDLQLADGAFNYKTMTFYAGDSVSVRLTENGQPVDFKFRDVPAASTDGVFNTNIESTDPGGTYYLICQDRECGSITVTVIGRDANANAATTVTKIEMQRLPAGITFTPGMSMETTATFNSGDQYALNVTGTFKAGDKFTHSIVDSNGHAADSPGSPSDLVSGTNSTCCYAVPSVAGIYTLKALVNGTEMGSTQFSVNQ